MYVHVHSSRDYPGIVCVSQESQDTQTRGMLQGELHVCTCTFIPGLSWDGLCIPGLPRNPRILGQGACCKESYMYMYIHPGIILEWSVYPRILRQRHGIWLCLIGQVKFIPGLSRDHILFILAVVLIPYVPKESPSYLGHH